MPDRFALTFDDGPDPRFTPALLDVLARCRARVTFFVMASAVARHPEALEATLAAGHDVELHCGRHLRHSRTPRTTIERDTDDALALLAEHGVRPRRWRLPWGDPAPWSAELAHERGLELVGWDLDTHDWRGDPASEMLAEIEPRLAPGAVVLMHDGLGPGARRGDCEETIALVPSLLEGADARGLAPGRLPEPAVATAA